MFYSFDGLDGVGKTTQLALFVEHLRMSGRQIVECHDPGSTTLGEAIRGILLREGCPIARTSEMLLFMAARAQLVNEVIQPALAAGRDVVCDRFLLANVVYQGYAGGLDVETLWRIGAVATCGLEPDLTFLLDMPHESSAERIDRQLDRMESQGAEFRQRVRQGFLTVAGERPDKIAVIDAGRSIHAVQSDIRRAAERLSR